MIFKVHRYQKDYSGIINRYNPSKPLLPIGKIFIGIDVDTSYKTYSFDPNNDNLYYQWNFGDGSYSDWIGPYDSGIEIELSHKYDKIGGYEIRVQAKDTNGLLSNQSDSLFVNVRPYKALLIGKIDSKTIKNNETSFWADNLFVFSSYPMFLKTYPFGEYMIVDNKYLGIISNNFIFGIFQVKG